MHKRKWLSPEMENGILFWSNLYIPVIVAMSATQNVKAAITGGLLALLAGIIPTALCIMLLPVLMKMGNNMLTEANNNNSTTPH
jgi:malonate transporter MadL subunit